MSRPGRVVVGSVAAGELDAEVCPPAQQLHHIGPLAVPGRHPGAPLKLHHVQRLQSRAQALGRVGGAFMVTHGYRGNLILFLKRLLYRYLIDRYKGYV